MDYSFNSEIAQKYGVNEAVFIHNLYWWICKNEANGRHFYDGKSWTYNSIEAMAKLFPFWSKDQIRRIADKLVKNGAVFKGNYNSSAYDRTCWYALSEEVLSVYRHQETTECICENSKIDLAELPNQNGKSAEPIPDSKPDSKPDIKQERAPAPARKPFGEFQKVLLTDEQYERLVQRLGKDETSKYICELDGYIASKGASYKDHSATILTWWRKDHPERAAPPKERKEGEIW